VSPLVFLGLWLLICAGAFAVGLRFFRMTEAPNEQITAAQAKRFGRLMMMASVAMVLFVGALWFHGDLKNIRLAGS
jgi:cytochrome c oxidase assembly factor CtaG